MKNVLKQILRWSLVIIAIASILVLTGEPMPDANLSNVLIMKTVAMIALVGCVFFGRYAQKKHMLPKGEKIFYED